MGETSRFRAWITVPPVLPAVLAAGLLGALGCLAMAPYSIYLALVPAFAGLLFLVDRVRRPVHALLVGWAFGFGYHFVGLTWVGEAFRVEADRYAWMIPIILSGLPALLGFFAGLAAWAYRRPGVRARRWSRPLAGPWRFIWFAGLWTVAEWLRGHVMTGFPWNMASYAWNDALAMQQTASIFGAYGLTLLTVLAAAAPGAVAGIPRLGLGRSWMPLLATVLIPAAMFVYGSARLAQHETAYVEDARVRVVQPNVPQQIKWKPELRGAIFQRLLDLSDREGIDDVTAVVWPETATPFRLLDLPEAIAAIAAIAPPAGVIAGTPRVEDEHSNTPRYYNGVAHVSRSGEARAIYDKSHLVPLGEYVPLRGILPVERVAPGRGDFTPGGGPKTIDIPGLPPVGIMVCYEVIFPGAVVDPDRRPEWMLNVTNDAWFGSSGGPRQHLAIARMRAVEEGLPMIRAANTGISAIIDPLGRILQTIDLGGTGILDTNIPKPAKETIYGKFGDTTVIALLFLLAAFLCILPRVPASRDRNVGQHGQGGRLDDPGDQQA